MATAKIEEREGIVLSRIPQKERDAMVRVLGPDGFSSFYARGALKVGGATGFCTQELCHSAFNLIVSSSGSLTLKEGRLLCLYAPQGGLDGMLVAQLLLEYCLRFLSEDDAPMFYPNLVKALEALENGGDPFSVAIMFLAKAANVAGYGLEVDHCVLCGSKTGIVTMDLIHGGFLCADCLPASSSAPCGGEELRIYRHAFRCPEEDFVRVHYPLSSAKEVLRRLLEHIQDQTGMSLKSLNPILKV